MLQQFYIDDGCLLQLLVSAMGPPGGGRNDITSRFSRHLQIVSIDEFDDDTMSRIFTSICDWHFGQGFDGSFSRLGKVHLMLAATSKMDVSLKKLIACD